MFKKYFLKYGEEANRLISENNDKTEKAIENYNKAIDINDDYDPAYEGKNQSMLEKHLQILDLQDSLIQRNLF